MRVSVPPPSRGSVMVRLSAAGAWRRPAVDWVSGSWAGGASRSGVGVLRWRSLSTRERRRGWSEVIVVVGEVEMVRFWLIVVL
jgi:hypothetical protein